MKMLLVDDEPGILKVLGISLADRGYEVFTADSGEKALEVFAGTRPSIVLTDIKMPGLDGIEVLRRIKQESPETEVIMITGHGDMDLAVQSLKNEASDFIMKPIDDEVLDIALKRAMEKISYRARLREYTEDLERLVQEKTEKLLQAERLAAVGQTVAGLAHAIKNIASGLTGGMYVLEKGIELEQRSYLTQGWEMIKGNVVKIKSVAMDLLNYAKERQPEYRLCDPNRPAREVYELMRAQGEEKGIDFKAELADDLDQAWFDPESIHRVLLNLVTNAFDACTDIGCPNRRPQVILRTLKPKTAAVQYQVSDNGCGMDEETRKKVFRLFFSTKGSKGTGLGLMIARKIVDEHGGEISLESANGRGTTFFVTLPGSNEGERFTLGSAGKRPAP
jgi:signal transduction histidine kinase